MKNRIALGLLLALSTAVTAQEAPPEYLKDGEITVVLKNGQKYTFQANDWKIVNRKAKALPAPLVEETEEVVEPVADTGEGKSAKEPASVATAEATVREKANEHFVVTLIPQVGVGPDGITTTQQAGGFVNEANRKAVFGATVCGGSSALPKICGSAFTNRLYTLGVGVDF